MLRRVASGTCHFLRTSISSEQYLLWIFSL